MSFFQTSAQDQRAGAGDFHLDDVSDEIFGVLPGGKIKDGDEVAGRAAGELDGCAADRGRGFQDGFRRRGLRADREGGGGCAMPARFEKARLIMRVGMPIVEIRLVIIDVGPLIAAL